MVTIFSLIVVANLLVGLECRTIVFSSSNEAISTAPKILGASKREFLQNPGMPKDIEYPGNLTNINDEIVDRKFDNEEIMRRFVATQGVNREKLLADFAASTVNSKDHEEKGPQWLQLLKQKLQSTSSDTKIEKLGQIDERFNDIGEIETILIEDDKKIIPVTGNWLGNLLEFLDERDIDSESSDDNESHVKSRYENSPTLFSLADENTEDKKDDYDESSHYSFDELDRILIGVHNEIERARKYFKKLCSKHHSMSSTRWNMNHYNHDQSSNIVDGKKL